MSEPRPHASQLPAEPNLRHLKDQAKDLLKSGKASSLAAAHFQIAQLYGFQSWPRLKSHVIDRTNAGKLKQAINQDDLGEVRLLLSKHPELRTAPIGYGEDGPLTWAAECRGIVQPSSARLSIVEWLIGSGSDVHEGGDAPLMRASLNGSRTSMMELLVRYGADVNAAWHGFYPIIFAPCETLDPTALAWLLQHGADPNCGDESTWQSRGKSHPGTALDYVLGTYVREKEALNASINLVRDAGGLSRYDEPGVIATIQGDSDSVKELLHGDPSLIDRKYPSLNIGTTAGRMLTLKGATLLHVAAEFGQVEVARLLLNAGSDVNASALTDSDGKGGQSPVFHAATQGGDFGIDVVRLLISRGANLNLQCRLPGHYERPEEVFEGTVLDYARLFPGTENRTLEELRRSLQGR
jgi:Ankyrin repeats (3 copies)/Ankyrin repeat